MSPVTEQKQLNVIQPSYILFLKKEKPVVHADRLEWLIGMLIGSVMNVQHDEADTSLTHLHHQALKVTDTVVEH